MDLQFKSVDWFLKDMRIGIKLIKGVNCVFKAIKRFTFTQTTSVLYIADTIKSISIFFTVTSIKAGIWMTESLFNSVRFSCSLYIKNKTVIALPFKPNLSHLRIKLNFASNIKRIHKVINLYFH